MRLSCAILALFALSFTSASRPGARYPHGPSKPRDGSLREADLAPNPAAAADSRADSPSPALLAQKVLRDGDPTTCVQINVKKTNTGAESFYRVGAAGAQYIDNNTLIAPLISSGGGAGVDVGLLNIFVYNMDLFSDDLSYTNGSDYQTLSYYNGYEVACSGNVCGDYVYSVSSATACPTIPTTCYAFNTDFYPNVVQSSTVNFFLEYNQSTGTVVCVDFTKPFGFATFAAYQAGRQYFWYDGSNMSVLLDGKTSWFVMYNAAKYVWCMGSDCVSFIPV